MIWKIKNKTVIEFLLIQVEVRIAKPYQMLMCRQTEQQVSRDTKIKLIGYNIIINDFLVSRFKIA